jgi:hypothetical protein
MLDKYAKAIIGAIVSALMAMQTGLLDGEMLPVEWIGVAIAFFVSLGAIWGIGEHNDKIEAKKVEAAKALAAVALPPTIITDKVVSLETARTEGSLTPLGGGSDASLHIVRGGDPVE